MKNKKTTKIILLLIITLLTICIKNKTLAATTLANYTVSDTITATIGSDGALTVTGTGEMPDYKSGEAPWYTDVVTNSTYKVNKIEIQSGITKIGKLSFQEFADVTTVSYPDTLTEIGEGAFTECKKITNFTAPSSLKIIGKGAFSYCTSIADISLNEGLEEIERYAFQEVSVTTVTIPSTLTRMYGEAFFDVKTLKEYKVASGNKEFYTDNGVLYYDPTEYLNVYICAFPIGSSITEYTIKDGVTDIDQSAFFNAVNLKKVTIPDSVVRICSYAFYNTGLTSVTVPKLNLDFFGSDVWCNCASLETVEFNTEVTGRLPLRNFWQLY